MFHCFLFHLHYYYNYDYNSYCLRKAIVKHSINFS